MRQKVGVVMQPFVPFEEYTKRFAKDKEAVKEALSLAILEDPDLFHVLLHDFIVASGGFTVVAEKSGLSRVAVHRMVAPKGNPNLNSIVKVSRGLGLVRA